MNGGSLGFRSPAGLVRKNSKIFGPKEKEKRSSLIYKIAKRKVQILLLLIAFVAVVLSFCFTITKDEVQPTNPDFPIGNSYHVRKFVSHGMISSIRLSPPKISVSEDKYATSMFYAQNADVNNDTLLPPQVPYSMAIPLQHPCQNFSLPPQPVDPKHPGPRPCNICYVPLELARAYMPSMPSVSPILKNLNYILEENLSANNSNGGSVFGGYPSLQQRNESFDIIESMSVHCGFVKGRKPGQGTGFDIDEADLFEMQKCRGVVIASAIFGNYDVMQQPKNVGEYSKRTACFYMFVDEETEASIKNSSTLDSTKRVGLWRVVVVRNLPYVDARRNGKVPKLLLHRIFPNARFSLWIDGKLELVMDPHQVLERFLWRENASFAISRHYRRFDVFDEAEANKAAAKYDNASIDNQIEFYKMEGLTHFSSAKYPITSDVPEGCVIIREHIPITNLFTCLWFNEVDRFTSRDQLSFSTVRDKIMSKVNWSINMFMDCERRNFVLQAYHRDILEQRVASVHHYPSHTSTKKSFRKPTPTRSIPSRKPPAKHGKGRKSGSRRHRLKGASSAMDPNSF